MRRTPKSIPISELQQEPGAQDLVRSEKMRPYLELLKAHIGGQETTPYLATLAELPLEERYVWRVISALKWAFSDLETENVLADLETLSKDDLKLVQSLWQSGNAVLLVCQGTSRTRRCGTNHVACHKDSQTIRQRITAQLPDKLTYEKRVIYPNQSLDLW